MIAQNLRYSPVNGLIVDWSDTSNNAFTDCGLPQPQECGGPNTGGSGSCDTCDDAIPIAEAIDTYDLYRWLPEVIVGIDDPDEEIAANYVRQTMIDFCAGGRVLQREVRIELQEDQYVYPVFPYVGEQIVGVIGTKINDCFEFCAGQSCSGNLYNRTQWRLDAARNELNLVRDRGCLWPFEQDPCVMKLLVWSAPTEDSCQHDVFLYDSFRKDIAQEARRAYATAVHFRDPLLVRSLPSEKDFEHNTIVAKTKAMNLPSAHRMGHGSTFGGRNCLDRRDYYLYRNG